MIRSLDGRDRKDAIIKTACEGLGHRIYSYRVRQTLYGKKTKLTLCCPIALNLSNQSDKDKSVNLSLSTNDCFILATTNQQKFNKQFSTSCAF
jgi:hypothetical protein